MVLNGQKKRPVTVGSAFRSQVNRLMKALKSCTPHYIRCIKPNVTKKPRVFDEKNCTRQVRYLGLLENVKVRRAGFAYRCDFPRFAKRYRVLTPETWANTLGGDARDTVLHLTNSVGWTEGDEFKLGKTKIFIQESTSLFLLEEILERKMNEACVVVQKAFDVYSRQQYYVETRHLGWEICNNGNKDRRRNSIDRSYRGLIYIYIYTNIPF